MKGDVLGQSAADEASPFPGRTKGAMAISLGNGRLAKATAATRSGLRRYPRELLASVRDARLPRRLVEPITALEAFSAGRIAAAWIGHATVLMRVGGITILTDPVFSPRIGMSVGSWTFGLPRLLPPALDVEHLPKIDLILLSHAHFDHLDKPSLRRLAQGPGNGATVITADRTRSLIPPGFARVIQLPWGRQTRVRGVRVTALQPRHWGARATVDRFRGYNAYLVEHGRDRVLFGGDTAATDVFDRIGPVDLSVLGIGAYESWDGAHATPEQAWRMFQGHAGGDRGRLLPMHHATFDMGEKHAAEPLERLIAAAGDARRLVVCEQVGDVWVVESGQKGGQTGVLGPASVMAQG